MSRTQSPSQLVVVGSSAGGIEALTTLVGGLPSEFPVPIVIAQHLDPKHQSHLAEILARESPLPVRTVSDREELTPGTIFVIPANRHVEIDDHHVTVRAEGPDGPKPSVDHLLATAATAFGERLIAVILTGSGSDGTAGSRAVKEADGMVIIQDPDTAAYPSMPRSLAPTTVDTAVSLENLGPLLGELVADGVTSRDIESDTSLQGVLDRVFTSRGVDFSTYKPSTIARRLHRRMVATGTQSFDNYLAYMDDHPEEEQHLISSFLIKVTEFFRDPALYEHLREQVLPELIAAAREGAHELRLWSAGCATGEEAYSLAVLVADLLAGERGSLDVRIFATDLDEEALAFARRGIYPAEALKNMPSGIVERHFTREDGDFQVNKAVRGMVLFGHHDLGQRPPFPNIDMVLCRNVLIYFAPELQRRVLQLFGHALRDGGYLVLGKAETPRPLADMFTESNRKLRLYRRDGPRPRLPAAHGPARMPARLTGEPNQGVRTRPSLEYAVQEARVEMAEEHDRNTVLERRFRNLPVGLAVIDRRYDIQVINAAARSWLGIHSLAIGEDFIHLAESIPSTALRGAIDAVARGEESAPLDVETVDTTTGDILHLVLRCYPDTLNGDDTMATILITVVDVTSIVNEREHRARSVTELERERDELKERSSRLAESNRHLLSANRDVTGAVQDLEEQNDSLRIANDGFQVSSEEIETLNEELQSTNEELETLNEETQATVEELNNANEDLQAKTVQLEELADRYANEQSQLNAILTNMDDAVLVVTRDGEVVRTNPTYDELMHGAGADFVPEDERGNPLPPEETPRRKAARGETFHQLFTMSEADGGRRWFEAAGRPLRLEDVDGGVVVIRDITDFRLRHLQDGFVAMASHELRTPLTALYGYLQMAERQLGEGGDPERLQRYLTGAITQAQRQVRLVEELMDVSRLETGKVRLNPEPTDLGPVVAQVGDLAQGLAEGHTIVVDAVDEPMMVHADPGRLEQVVLNLVNNALKHAPESERIEIRLKRDGGEAVIEVRDQGKGIPKGDLATIFERFSQSGRSHRMPGEDGLGLGLFISREIVRAHGGSITAESQKGKGATFTIRLPLLEDSSANP